MSTTTGSSRCTLTSYSMEKCNDEDFRMLFEYRKNITPDLEQQSRILDFGIVQDLICGLQAQGVDNADIAGGRTRLIRMIHKYVNTGIFLRHGKIVPKEHRGDGDYSDVGDNSIHDNPSKSPPTQEHTDTDRQMGTFSSLTPSIHQVTYHQLVEISPADVAVPIDDSQIIDPIYVNQSMEAHTYEKNIERSIKRCKQDETHPGLEITKAAVALKSMSPPTEFQQGSTSLNDSDCSTDIEEWLQEFGNIDPSNGMQYVVRLLGQW